MTTLTTVPAEEITRPHEESQSNPARSRHRFNPRRIPVVAVIVAFSAYFLLPLVWLIVNSTKSNGQLVSTFGFWFAVPLNLWNNLSRLVTTDGGIFLRWMGNSFIYSAATAAGSTLLCALAGYAFAKYQFRGRNVMFAVILGAVMVPGTALVLPIFLLMSAAHLVDTYWAVILPGLVNPVGLYLCRLFWNDSLPDDLIDAARIDGAGDVRIFAAIGLPLMKNGLTTVALLAFVGTWNNIFLPLVVLSHSDLFPVVQGLSAWNLTPASGVTVDYGVVLLGSLVSVIPLVIAFVSLARYWQTGLTVGATKS